MTRVNADEYPAKVAAESTDFDPKHLWKEKMRAKWIVLHILQLHRQLWL